MYIVQMNDDELIAILKIIKLGKNLGRNEKIHVGIPKLDIFQLQPRNSKARKPTNST